MERISVDKAGDGEAAAHSGEFPKVTLAVEHLSVGSVVRHFGVALIPTIGTIAAIGLWVAGIGPGVQELVLLAVFYSLNMLGVEIALHRYFAHRSFKTGNAMQIAFAILGSLSYMGPLMWWVAIHRLHHVNSDKPGDPHTPQLGGPGLGGKIRGLLYGHVGWLFDPEAARPKTWGRYATDMYCEPALLKIHHAYDFWLVLGLLLPTLIGGLLSMSLMGALLGFLWGGTVRVFLATNAVWAINSIGHSVGGSRPFTREDQSRNTFWLAIVTFGIGWHNNHHAFPQYAMSGFHWWQIDISGWVLNALERMGLVWDVRRPDPEAIEAKRRAMAME